MTIDKKAIAKILVNVLIPAIAAFAGYLGGKIEYAAMCGTFALIVTSLTTTKQGKALASTLCQAIFVRINKGTGKKIGMFIIVLLLVFLPLICVCGCNNMQATTSMDSIIKARGTAAENDLVGNNIADPANVKDDIVRYANIIHEYYDTATTSVWAYWFNGKEILLSQAMYDNLEDMDVAVTQFEKRIVANTSSDADNAERWRYSNGYILAVRNWCYGMATPKAATKSLQNFKAITPSKGCAK